MKKKVIAVLLLVAWALSACGTGGGAADSDATGTLAPVPPDYAGKRNLLGSAGAGAGAQLFKSNCEACHGAQGHGDGPAGVALEPPPKNLAQLNKTASDDYLFWRISTGRPGSAMPAWKGVLTDEQIWQLVSFVRTLK